MIQTAHRCMWVNQRNLSTLVGCYPRKLEPFSKIQTVVVVFFITIHFPSFLSKWLNEVVRQSLLAPHKGHPSPNFDPIIRGLKRDIFVWDQVYNPFSYSWISNWTSLWVSQALVNSCHLRLNKIFFLLLKNQVNERALEFELNQVERVF